MSLDNPNGIESSVSKNMKQRRTFLKRTSAVTVVASLPLSSSWATTSVGCSVSGNLSGNLSNQQDVCTISGDSPSVWGASGAAELTTIWNNILTNRPPFDTNLSSSDLVSAVLANGGLDAAFLAAYLNAAYGKYGELTSPTAEDYVQGLYDQVTGGLVSESDMLAAIESTYPNSI